MVTKKQKQRKNADFAKVKLKVGKKLKKTTTTDTTIQTKKLVLTAQLGEKVVNDAVPLSFRGLSLEELCKQLGHFNKTIRQDALRDIKQLLISRPDLIASQLRNLIPSIARLLSENNDPSFNGQLRALLRVICSTPEDTMGSHFTLFMAHVLRAITHMELNTRLMALSILSNMMTSYPKLCRNSTDLFESFVKFLGSARKPNWNAPKFLDTILCFLSVFENQSNNKYSFNEEYVLDTSGGTLNKKINLLSTFVKTSAFDCPILTSTSTSTVSPFEVPESLIKLSTVLVPIITTSVMEDKAGGFLTVTCNILESIGRIAAEQPNSFLVSDFRSRLCEVWAPVKKATVLRKLDKYKISASWI